MSEISVAFDAETISERIKELGVQIREDAGDREVFLIGILKGSSIFLGDVLRAIPGKVHFEWVHVVYDVNDTEIADATQISTQIVIAPKESRFLLPLMDGKRTLLQIIDIASQEHGLKLELND